MDIGKQKYDTQYFKLNFTNYSTFKFFLYSLKTYLCYILKFYGTVNICNWQAPLKKFTTSFGAMKTKF